MRSPYPTPGRNRRLENLWQLISGFVRRLFTGSQRPISRLVNYRDVMGRTSRDRFYDLEIPESPIRNAEMARDLIEMREFSLISAAAIDYITGDVFSSSDGDDQGFTIADTLTDESPIDKRVYDAAMGVLGRCFSQSLNHAIVAEMLWYGDRFAEIAIARNGSQVDGLMILPTWEMFRREVQGDLLGFDQRRRLWEETPDYAFPPGKIAHWRFQRKNLYGRSLFAEARQSWAELKQATRNLGDAANALGVNPIIHTIADADAEYLESYRQRVRDTRADGVVTDYYLLDGESMMRLSTANPDLKPLVDTVLYWRMELITKSRVPPYLLGAPQVGARDIQGAPERAYARFVNQVRGCFSEGVLQVIYTELALKGIDPALWLNRLRLVYPKIHVLENGVNDESEATGITDTESSTNGHHKDRKLVWQN